MPSKWSGKIRQELYKRDDMVCCYCEKVCKPYTDHDWLYNPRDVVTLDHVISQWHIAQQTKTEAEFKQAIKNPKNLVVVCNGCNSSKKKTDLYTWCRKRGYNYTRIMLRIAERTLTHA